MTTIDFVFVNRVPFKIFIKNMFDVGWSTNDEGNIWYIPYQETSMYNWEKVPISEWPNVYEELLKKEEDGEKIWITLIHEAQKTGGIFQISNREIQFSPTIHRKIIDELSDVISMTDINWYIKKIVPALTKSEFKITQIEGFQSFE